MSRSNSEKKLGAGRVVAVAIENNKTSQHAAKWAVDNLLPKDQSLYLIHVRQRASSNSTPAPDVKEEVVPDNESKELFESFRVFCNRKSIQCKEVLLEDTDISKAIVESISTYSIELMVLGAPARGGLVRYIYLDLPTDPGKNVSVADKNFLLQKQKYFYLNIIRFRATDVPSSVTKGAPPFCTVYIISKGKISSVKSASAPLPSNKSAPSHKQLQSQPVRNPDRSMDHPPTRNYPPRARSAAPLAPEKPAYGTSQVQDDLDIISPFTRPGRSMQKYESSIPADCDISFVSNGRPSIDRMFPSLYDDLDTGMVPPRFSSGGTDFESISIASSFSGSKSIDMSSPKDHDYSFSSSQASGILSSRVSSDSTDEMEAEMRRLKLELKQTMDMYSTACKEALTAKQKAMELQRWKLEEEKRMEEGKIAEEAAMTLVEKEKEKSRVALKAAEASQRIAVLEAQKRMNAEMRGQTESNTRKKTEDSFGANRYRRYTIEEIEEATKGLSDSLKIGEGGYGPVYRCELDHTQVAIKVLKPDAVQGREQFQQEVEVLSCIRHPNMVLLLGACPEYGCLVYEYMANGSLDDCLFRRGKSRALPWQLRFQIAAEIATGLLFLHQTKPEPLVHRDLKPGNVLLDRNYVSKISDVGLARLVPPSVADTVTQYRMTSTAGTFCYIDPEYQQTGMLGIKSDIYSLGIMLLQIVTAKPPMGLTHHVARSIEKGTFVDMLDPSVEDWPIEQTLHFAKLALKCAEMRRKDRPDLGKVVLPELNKLRAFAEENMPMMMMFGGTTGFTSSTTGFTSSTTGFNSRSSTSSTGQDIRSESQTLSGISGYESRSSTSSLGRM